VRVRWLRPLGLAALAVVSWVDAAFFPLGLVVLAVPWLLLAREARVAGAVLLLATPWGLLPPLGLALGVHDYVGGAAARWSRGHGRWDHADLDPDLRVYAAQGAACIPSFGVLLLLQLPDELVVRALATVLGPPPGAYTGPYPSADEVLAALDLESVEPTWPAEDAAWDADQVVGIGEHELVVPGFVWRTDRDHAFPRAAVRAAVEPGTPAPRWAVLAGCTDDGPVALVYAFESGESFVRYDPHELPADAAGRLGCGDAAR
jgi:hypothetical protein